MLLRAFAAATLLLAQPPEYGAVREYPLVHRVVCREALGTAFRIGPTRFLSVAHVTSNHDCRIDGDPIHIIEQDGHNDFSIIEAGRPKIGAIRIDCDGFRPGQWYWGIGNAAGLPVPTILAAYATIYREDEGKRLLIGPTQFIPGMSGGVVMNQAGEAVGTINSRDLGNPFYSYSRELR